MLLLTFGVVMLLALIFSLLYAPLEVVVLVTLINVFGFSFFIKDDDMNNLDIENNNHGVSTCVHTEEDCENCLSYHTCVQQNNKLPN